MCAPEWVVSQHSLYKWTKEQQLPPGQHKEQLSQMEELRRLKAELKGVSEERDILKEAALNPRPRSLPSYPDPGKVRVYPASRKFP